MAVLDSLQMPFRYVDSIELKKHILLLYEDDEYAKLIESRFIKNGLVSGERCIYATDEDPGGIILKFLRYGIPLKYFENGSLRVIKITRTFGSRDEILKKCKKDLESILNNLLPPFRIVSRIVPDVSTTDGISLELELEKFVHRRFDDFRGSLICPYDISKIEPTRKRAWLDTLRQTHHAMIYLPKFGEPGVFCSC